MKSFKILLLSLLLLLNFALAACGQPGPLYLPDKASPTHWIDSFVDMDYFNYTNNALFAEDVAIADIVSQHGTPSYIYSRATIEGIGGLLIKRLTRTRT